jgi:hypothetical protein
MKKCKECKCEIPEARVKALPTATQCVKCSTTGKKAGITVTMGEGDHTYNEIVIIDSEEYEKFQETERKIYGTRKDDILYSNEELEEEEIEDELNGIEEIKNIDLIDFEEIENIDFED